MTQAQLIEKVAAATNLTKAQAKAAFDAIVVNLKEVLDEGDTFRVPEIGTLVRVEKAPRDYKVPGEDRMVSVPKRYIYKLRGKKQVAED